MSRIPYASQEGKARLKLKAGEMKMLLLDVDQIENQSSKISVACMDCNEISQIMVGNIASGHRLECICNKHLRWSHPLKRLQVEALLESKKNRSR